MKTVVLLSLSLTVALGVPVLPPGVEQPPVVRAENQSPLLGDLVPVQGHVVVENPAPQIGQGKKRTPVDLKLKESMDEEKPQVKAEPGAKLEPEVKVEKTEPEMEKELQAEPDFKVESEVKEEESNVVEEEVKPEAEEPEPDFKVDSEVKVEPDVQTEEEPKELLDVHSDMMTDERLVEPEGRYEPMNEPVMELEPLEEEEEFEEEETHNEPSDEKMSFRREDYVGELLPEEEEEEEEDKVEEEEEFLRKRSNVLDEQPVMELEPEMTEEAAPNHAVMSGGAELDEEPSLEQQVMPLSETYPPDEEAQMEMLVREEQFPELFVKEPAEEDEGLQLDVRQQALMREANGQGERYCPGMLIEGKCYQFFKAPKTYADAELFCQNQFPRGHLASITSHFIHRDVMNLMLMQNGGYTRTWVGGRRLDSYRFVWLDGSKWTYDDWLPGEPNNTAGKEDCVELLALGNGLFNDFTCWTPQPFICSHPYL